MPPDKALELIRITDEEPWGTAREILADQGYNAEFYVVGLATRLADAGNVEDAARLGDVLDAISAIRELEDIRPSQVQH